MNLLYINGCIRGAKSRTEALARCFLEAYAGKHPDAHIQTVNLNELRPLPFFEDTLAKRDASSGHWEEDEFAPARAFREADFIVLAAPFWEGTFPAAVHAYLERICVTGLTFLCTDRGYVGQCRADRAVLITTRGGIYESGPAVRDDHAAAYLGSILRMLGVPHLYTLAAEGLDIEGADITGILEEARKKAVELADRIDSSVE